MPIEWQMQQMGMGKLHHSTVYTYSASIADRYSALGNGDGAGA